MNEFKSGDRVVTWMDDVGTVVGPADREHRPYEVMVLVDGDIRPTPYMNKEIMLEEEYNAT